MSERQIDQGAAADRRFMARALELARLGDRRASPNPMVGCVIVKNGEIVGEGFHAGPGTPHAEAAAIADASAASVGATAYVTLEPCNHWGRNPPCSEGLLTAGVAEVVYALADPNAAAAGGAARLRAAGLAVRGPVLEADACALNAGWLRAMRERRPYVTAKLAMSLDGRIAAADGTSKWITGPEARAAGHALRASHHAILVGADTVIADNPELTARPGDVAPEAVKHPVRIVLDSSARTDPDARVFARDLPARTILATTDAAPRLRRRAFAARDVDVMVLPATETGRVDLGALLEALYQEGLTSLLVEGGATVSGAFFDAGFVDDVAAFIAPVVIGGDGRPAVGGRGADTLSNAFRLENAWSQPCGADVMVRGRIARAAAPNEDITEVACLRA